jgi:hypothetical protein
MGGRRNSLITLFEIRGRSWLVKSALALALALLGFFAARALHL